MISLFLSWSAYRPQAYQNHLRQVRDRAIALQGNTDPECAQLKLRVNAEMANHRLTIDRPVAQMSLHTSGRAVDISWSLPGSSDPGARIDELAIQAGLRHELHDDPATPRNEEDRPHFNLP